VVDDLALWMLNFRIKRLAAYRLNAWDTQRYKHREEEGARWRIAVPPLEIWGLGGKDIASPEAISEGALGGCCPSKGRLDGGMRSDECTH